MSRWIVPVIVLPGTVLIFVPTLIVMLTDNTTVAAAPVGPTSLQFWLGVLFGVPSAGLALWSMRMFVQFGAGTAAPWDPPQRLVVRGPYRHVRNPMLSGVIGLLIAESLLVGSWPLAAWAGLFALGNMIYFPFSEEPALVKRFGDDYRVYSENVRRWIPRITPWTQPELPDVAEASSK